jgi:hypothetical protein
MPSILPMAISISKGNRKFALDLCIFINRKLSFFDSKTAPTIDWPQ